MGATTSMAGANSQNVTVVSMNDIEAFQRNRDIENELEKEKQRQMHLIKLLLLGPGESGKSTFVKQMKILHMQGFSDDDRRLCISLVHANVLEAMKLLLSALEEIPFQDDGKLKVYK